MQPRGAAPASYPAATAEMGAFDDFVIVADSVMAERDAAADGLEAARVAANRQAERAHDSRRDFAQSSEACARNAMDSAMGTH